MKIAHITRGFFWSAEVSRTMLQFWVKHPQETPAVLSFMLKKFSYFPLFLSRNIKTEEQTKSYEELLQDVQIIYQKYSKAFDPFDNKTYKSLEKHLSDKYQILYFLIRKTKPKVVVETGVAAGQSTGYILQALNDNGRGVLHSIDLPFQWYIYGKHVLHLDSLPAGKMPGYLVPDSLKKQWILHLGDTYKELPKLVKKLGNIDIFFHDSEHSFKTMTFEYTEAWPHISKKGFLMSDDTDFTNAFQRFAQNNKRKEVIIKTIGVLAK